MAISEQLEVYLGLRHVGTLSQGNGRLAFRYDRQWLDDPCSHPLSLSLPLREAPFADPETRIWFGNLLPEGDFLNAVARRLGRNHWEKLAEELEIAPRAVFRELARLTRVIETVAQSLAGQFAARYGCGETVGAILELIRRRNSRAWAFLGGRPD